MSLNNECNIYLAYAFELTRLVLLETETHKKIKIHKIYQISILFVVLLGVTMAKTTFCTLYHLKQKILNCKK